MPRPRFRRREKREFDQAVVDVARVTRVVAGGRRFRFRATVVIGDRKYRVGVGVAKGADVSDAVGKAVAKAKKNLIEVPIVNTTIPHVVHQKFEGADIMLKPAGLGTGIIAGGAIRSVVSLAGIKNVVSKMFGSNNKIANVKAAWLALKNLQTTDEIVKRRGISGKKLERPRYMKEEKAGGKKAAVGASEKLAGKKEKASVKPDNKKVNKKNADK